MEFAEETGVDTHYSSGVELKNILLILSGSFIRFIGRTYFLIPAETFGKFTRAFGGEEEYINIYVLWLVNGFSCLRKMSRQYLYEWCRPCLFLSCWNKLRS